MEGEKVTPFVIGKSKMPRCMKNVKNLPVAYDANKNVWMTSLLFNSWSLANKQLAYGISQ